jgi:hypothetical protein
LFQQQADPAEESFLAFAVEACCYWLHFDSASNSTLSYTGPTYLSGTSPPYLKIETQVQPIIPKKEAHCTRGKNKVLINS